MNRKKPKGGLKEAPDVANISNNFFECLQLVGEDANLVDEPVNKKKKGTNKPNSAKTSRNSASSNYAASTVLKISPKGKEASAAKASVSTKVLQNSSPEKASAVKASATKVLQSSLPGNLEMQAAVNDQSTYSEEMRSDGDGSQPSGSEQPKPRTLMYNYPLVWIDLEMTGLDVEKDKILEIAVIVTDGKLDNAIEGPDLVIHQPESVLNSMNAWCQAQHNENGLVERVRESKVTLEEAEEKVIAFVRPHVPRSGCQLAGNCVYTDLWFLKKHMPRLADLFNHVVVDVSSVRQLCLRWHKPAYRSLPVKTRAHRSMDDIRESIEELRYFKNNIFK